MPRAILALLLGALLAGAEDAPAPRRLAFHLVPGQRVSCSNVIAFEITTVVREGQKKRSTVEAVKRTERFVDVVRRAGRNGVLEIDRSYLKLFSTARTGRDGSKLVYRSPLQGRRVTLREHNRRRELRVEKGIAADALARRTAGIELDWRDIFPDDPVRPGDSWDGEAGALSRRLAAYLDSGSRGRMRVRYEENVVRDGSEQAKLYVDWVVEGMRDRHLFTKVTLAGDVFFDFGLGRVVEADLTGAIVVRGALVGAGPPRIVKGEGPVTLKTTIKPAPVEAAAAPPAGR